MQVSRASLAVLALFVGCGGTVTEIRSDPSSGGAIGSGASGSADHAGSSGAGSGGSTTTGGAVEIGGSDGVSGGCGPALSPATPTPVKFVFTSDSPVWLQGGCDQTYQLFSCSSGSTPLVETPVCAAVCSTASTNDCVTCVTGCPNLAIQVGPNPGGLSTTFTDAWDGEIYTYGTLPSGCRCASGVPAAPGTYTLTIPVFITEADAMANTNAYPHTTQFQLPAPNGVVTVDVGFQGL